MLGFTAAGLLAGCATVQEQFGSAVCRNDLKKAEKCLAQGADVNAADEKGLAPLHYAAACNHPEMVKFLLSRGADVNKTNKWLWTPLHYALGGDQETEDLRRNPDPEGSFKVVKLLVEAKANINAGDDHGVSPVYLAIGCGDLAILQYLADHGGCFDHGCAYRWQTPLHWAITNGASGEVVEFILKHGGKKIIDVADGNGNAPLHYAVRNNDLKVVKCLVENGADINIARDIDECETPLDLAEEAKLPEIVKYLKSHGALSGKLK